MDDLDYFELEKRGEYDAAAAGFATAGFEKLLSSHARLTFETRRGIGMILRAISCDVRTDNTRRAAFLYNAVEPLLEELAENAEREVLRGVATEWHGDAALMVGCPNAVDRYQAARSFYEDLTWRDKSVLDEPDFMHAYRAMQGFAEHHDVELPLPDRSTTFQQRIDAKLSLAEELLGT